MMTMAKVEEAAQKAWAASWAAESQAHANHPEQCPDMLKSYLKGFIAGVAFAQRQAKIEGSSPAVGNITAKKEHNKFVVWKMEDLSVLFREDNLARYFDCLVTALQVERKIQGKGENRYIVCNQDEPYAAKVWEVILEGESRKEKPSHYPAAGEEPEEEV